MENNKTVFGKVFFNEVFNILEQFLNISDYDDEQDYKDDKDKDIIKKEVSREILNKKQCLDNKSQRKSKRKTRIPIRYGYDE